MGEQLSITASRPHICVAGFGHWGKNLTRNFSQLGNLYGCCESHEGRRASFSSQYPGTRAFESFDEALADPQVDAIVLASPAEQHYAMGMAALKAGKDLFVEKPLALDWQEGARMVEAAQAGGRILMVGHLLRHHPALLKIQELLREGVLGRIEYIYSNRLSLGKIRSEENALWSFAPHDISVILALMGHLPLQVSCTGGAYLQPNIADVTVSNLLFKNGARAHIFVSWLHPYKEQRLVINGSKKMLVFEDSRPDKKLLLYDRNIEVKDGVLEANKGQAAEVAFPADEPLRQECSHFVQCVANRTEASTPGTEGVHVLQVLQACQRSMEMNGEPVQIQDIGSQKLSRL